MKRSILAAAAVGLVVACISAVPASGLPGDPGELIGQVVETVTSNPTALAPGGQADQTTGTATASGDVTTRGEAKPKAAPAEKCRGDVRCKPFAFTATTLPVPAGFDAFSEPSIALNSKDHVYFCGPLGIGDGNAFVRSPDWTTFERFNIHDLVTQGEDCDVKVGADNAVYEASLQIYGSAIRKSVMDGQGPPAPPNTNGNGSFDYQVYEDTVEQDRQWLAPDPVDASIVYFAYHDLAAEAMVVAKSLDGGKTFPFHTITSNDPTLAPDTFPNTYSGPIRVDPADHLTVVQASRASATTSPRATPPLRASAIRRRSSPPSRRTAASRGPTTWR